MNGNYNVKILVKRRALVITNRLDLVDQVVARYCTDDNSLIATSTQTVAFYNGKRHRGAILEFIYCAPQDESRPVLDVNLVVHQLVTDIVRSMPDKTVVVISLCNE